MADDFCLVGRLPLQKKAGSQTKHTAGLQPAAILGFS
jgi:hypothetical protein